MYEEKIIKNKKVFYSKKLNIEHFFTSRELIVKDNIELVSSYLKIPAKNLIKPHQTHSCNIEFLKENKYDYPDCDSLILTQKNYAIYLNFADCTPIILYDKKKNIVAIAHAGWRGTVSKIAPKTVFKMHSEPKDIIALIGPCISFKCFETSNEIIEKLKTTLKNPEGLFNTDYADLKGINQRQLEEIGVREFDICPYCTVLDNDKFFSYRKENKTKNRHSAVVRLNF